LPGPKKTQYWFLIDQDYMVMTANLTSVKGLSYNRTGRISRQGFTFTIDEPDLDGVTFQLTRKNKLGIFAPEGAGLEIILEGMKPYLDAAADTPVRLTPVPPPSAPSSTKEDDLETIAEARLAVALGRCYGLLFDLDFVLSRTFKKSTARDRRRVRVSLEVMKNLLLKYNPSLKREGLERDERKALEMTLSELLIGGFWWGKKFVKSGLKARYLDALGLAIELPEGPAREETMKSLSLFSEVAGRLDEKLKDLPSADALQPG
jgi:hypothetical protein